MVFVLEVVTRSGVANGDILDGRIGGLLWKIGGFTGGGVFSVRLLFLALDEQKLTLEPGCIGGLVAIVMLVRSRFANIVVGRTERGRGPRGRQEAEGRTHLFTSSF